MKYLIDSRGLVALLALSSFHLTYCLAAADTLMSSGGAVVDESHHGTADPEENEESSTGLRGARNVNGKQEVLKDHLRPAAKNGAAAALSSSSNGDLVGDTSGNGLFARHLQEATGDADAFINQYTEDVLFILGLEEPPSNRTELLVLMGPFIADVRANLAKEVPGFNQSLITDEQLVDLFFPPPVQSSASNSTDTKPLNNAATNSTDQSTNGGNSTVGLFGYDDSNGDGGRRLLQSEGCYIKLSKVIELSLNYLVSTQIFGFLFTKEEAQAAGIAMAAGVGVEARKYVPFRYGDLPRDDKAIPSIVSAAITAAADMKGFDTLLQEAMSVWTGAAKAKYILAGGFVTEMATNLASAELGSFIPRSDQGCGTECTTKWQDMKDLLKELNTHCGAFSSTPCYDSTWTYNGPSTSAKVCTTGWQAFCQEDCAKKRCQRSGGTWAGLDACCNPYTCNYPIGPSEKTYVCPPGWDEAGKGYNGKTGLKCTKGWAPDCDEGCARAQCSSKDGRWANLDPCCNPYTCYLGVKCPKYTSPVNSEPNYYPWSAVGPGPNGQNGLTCTASNRAGVFEQGNAQDTCTGQGGQFPALDFGSNPYTCYMPEP